MRQTKTFTLKTQEAVTLWENFKENYQEANNANLSTDQAVAEAMIDTVSTTFKPFVLDKNEKKELQAKISEYEQRLEQLEKFNKKLTTENFEKSNQIKEFSTKNNLLSDKTSDILIKYSDLNPTTRALVERYITKPDIIKLFKKYNMNGIWKSAFSKDKPAGTYNKFFDVINTENQKENVKNFILTVFLLSAMGEKIPPITTNAKIKTSIEKHLKINEL